jgi:predicted PilT family ATPase
MEVPNGLMNKVLSYLLQQAEAGDTEAEELLDELNELVNLKTE